MSRRWNKLSRQGKIWSVLKLGKAGGCITYIHPPLIKIISISCFAIEGFMCFNSSSLGIVEAKKIYSSVV